ncbi:hypothetical protein EON65_08715 [archaeon]|nr:MAG: hypothetical protein EON65_08715 [archaeon]
MFPSDTQYMDFCGETLSPALTAITSSISKDLLWKPVNHQILMLTRNKHPAVKRVAVNLLRDLFTQVYLHVANMLILIESVI